MNKRFFALIVVFLVVGSGVVLGDTNILYTAHGGAGNPAVMDDKGNIWHTADGTYITTYYGDISSIKNNQVLSYDSDKTRFTSLSDLTSKKQDQYNSEVKAASDAKKAAEEAASDAEKLANKQFEDAESFNKKTDSWAKSQGLTASGTDYKTSDGTTVTVTPGSDGKTDTYKIGDTTVFTEHGDRPTLNEDGSWEIHNTKFNSQDVTQVNAADNQITTLTYSKDYQDTHHSNINQVTYDRNGKNDVTLTEGNNQFTMSESEWNDLGGTDGLNIQGDHLVKGGTNNGAAGTTGSESNPIVTITKDNDGKTTVTINDGKTTITGGTGELEKYSNEHLKDEKSYVKDNNNAGWDKNNKGWDSTGLYYENPETGQRIYPDGVAKNSDGTTTTKISNLDAAGQTQSTTSITTKPGSQGSSTSTITTTPTGGGSSITATITTNKGQTSTYDSHNGYSVYNKDGTVAARGNERTNSITPNKDGTTTVDMSKGWDGEASATDTDISSIKYSKDGTTATVTSQNGNTADIPTDILNAAKWDDIDNIEGDQHDEWGTTVYEGDNVLSTKDGSIVANQDSDSGDWDLSLRDSNGDRVQFDLDHETASLIASDINNGQNLDVTKNDDGSYTITYTDKNGDTQTVQANDNDEDGNIEADEIDDFPSEEQKDKEDKDKEKSDANAKNAADQYASFITDFLWDQFLYDEVASMVQDYCLEKAIDSAPESEVPTRAMIGSSPELTSEETLPPSNCGETTVTSVAAALSDPVERTTDWGTTTYDQDYYYQIALCNEDMATMTYSVYLKGAGGKTIDIDSGTMSLDDIIAYQEIYSAAEPMQQICVLVSDTSIGTNGLSCWPELSTTTTATISATKILLSGRYYYNFSYQVYAGKDLTYTIYFNNPDVLNVDLGSVYFGQTITKDGPAQVLDTDYQQVCIRTDDSNAQTACFQFTFVDVNDPPVLAEIPALTANEDQEFFYTVTATDPENNELYYYTDSLLFNIDTTTGEIRFTPSDDMIGAWNFTVSVTDSLLTDSKNATITIANTNDAPSMTGGQVTMSAASSTIIDISQYMTDVDNSNADLHCYYAGADLNFQVAYSMATQTATLTTSSDWVGPSAVRFDCCDPSKACGSATITVVKG